MACTYDERLPQWLVRSSFGTIRNTETSWTDADLHQPNNGKIQLHGLLTYGFGGFLQVTTSSPEMHRGSKFLRVGFWQNGFFCGFLFWSIRISSRILSPDSFLIFVGEIVHREIHQENPRQNPPKFTQQESLTTFCRGAGPKFPRVAFLAQAMNRHSSSGLPCAFAAS